MRYYRVHTAENAYLTRQPRGIFTAVWRLGDDGILSEAETAGIYEQLTFYRDMAAKYGLALYLTECNELPGEVIYEDDYQIAVKNQRNDLPLQTRKIQA